MAQNSVDELGSTIGNLSRSQDETEQNISSDDAGQSFNFEFTVPIALTGTVQGIKKTIASDSFVLDHPVYGELNSSELKLNGGYAESTGDYFTFPGTFPMTFTGGVAGTSVEFTITF